MSTNPDPWHVLSPYLDQALTLPEEERARWLESLRRENPALASQLQALLHSHRMAEREGFLEKGPSLPSATAGLAGQMLGAYKLISPIGQGGMGTVWRAERCDGRFERQAAVKFLNLAVSGHGGEERFKREGAILGRLSHPHIAELLDAGVSEAGQPYLVLEHVDGDPIDRYCDERKLDIEARVRLFLDVLGAVAHAHANLIVHRDIKPSNVLVSKDGQVKLLDFGIAKLLEGEGQEGAATLLTREAGSALTPEYAAPEQVTGAPVTTATDVYGLGVLLYVLLTGQHPAGPGQHSPAELLKAITETDPPRPSDVVVSAAGQAAPSAANRAISADKLSRQLRGDLDTIAAKALKKNPQERYGSVAALAEDLTRYLRNKPISARPDTVRYRAVKFVRRNRTIVTLATVALVALAAGAVGTLLEARTARIQRDLARTQRDFALRQLSRAEVINDLDNFLLVDAAPMGKPFTVNQLLARAEHIVERQHDPANRVELLMSIGRKYWAQDQDARAGSVLEEAYRLSRGMGEASIRAQASCELASALSRGVDSTRAEALIQEGLAELPRKPEFVLDRILCLERGSEVARESDLSQEGIARALAARELVKQSPLQSELLELRTLMDLAESYREAGQYRDAIPVFEQASRLMESLGRDDTQNAGTLLNNWALALHDDGRPLEAEKLFRRAIDISRGGQSEDAVSPMLLNNYARTLRVLGRWKEAARTAERAYFKAKQADDRTVFKQAMMLRARVYIDQHDFVRATAMLAEADAMFRRDLPPGHSAFTVLTSEHALLEMERGNLEPALRLANEAMDKIGAAAQSGKGQAAYLVSFLLLRRSDIERRLSKNSEAVADASRALSLLRAAADPGKSSCEVGRAYLLLARALQAERRTDEARSAFRSAAEQLEPTVGSDHPDTRAARQLAGLETSHQ